MGDVTTQVLKGTLDLMVLKALQWGPRHGYGVTQWIRRASGDALQVDDGALYPALYRLDRRGWIRSDWGVSENNRRAKYYRLTARGRAQLETELENWSRFSRALGMLLAADE